jgi:hypothetical protein
MRAIYGILFSLTLVSGIPRIGYSSELSSKVACARLQARVAKLSGIPASGPKGLGWYCDFADSPRNDWFVIALRSGRRCEGICSNLMGWYAVQKSTGSVNDYDVGEMTIGGPLGKAK